jgi:hypothetical protein
LALSRPSPGAAEAPARLPLGIDALRRRLNRRQGARDVEFEKPGKVKLLFSEQGIGAQQPSAACGEMDMKKMLARMKV